MSAAAPTQRANRGRGWWEQHGAAPHRSTTHDQHNHAEFEDQAPARSAPKSDTAATDQVAPKASARKPAEATPKRQTKASMVEGLLARMEGASLDAMCKATGWQVHTCRAFLTGLRTKGMDIARDKDAAGTTIYKLGEVKGQRVAS